MILKDTFLALPPSGRLSPGVISTPFYEKWGWSENGVFEFLANFELLNAVLIWHWDIFWDAGQHLILPAIALGHHPDGGHRPHDPLQPARHPRARLRAHGAGQGPAASAWSCAATRMRNSMLPVVTVIGLSLGTLIGGAILTETIFNLTGVGKTLYDAITRPRLRRDPGLHPRHRRRLRDRQPDHRRRLHVPRSPGAGELMLIDPADQGPFEEKQAEAAITGITLKSHSLWRDAFRQTLRIRSSQIGLVLLGFLLLLAVFAPLIAPYGPNEVLLGTGVQVRERAVHPPVRLRRLRAAAHPRHRRQRPRRVQPHRLRRPALAARRAVGAVTIAVLIGTISA